MASSLQSYPAFFSKFEVEENSNSFLDALFKGLIILTVKNYIFLDLCSLNTPGQVTSCPKTYLNTLIKSPLTLHFGKLPRLSFSATATSLQQIQITFWPFLWFLLNMIWQKKYYCKDSLYDVGPARYPGILFAFCTLSTCSARYLQWLSPSFHRSTLIILLCYWFFRYRKDNLCSPGSLIDDRFVLSIWVSRVRWRDTASGRPLTLQSASYPRLTDLELNLQGSRALLELLPEGCCGQQLYFSIYVNLLMWFHPCCTDSVAISTQLNPDPSMVLAGLPHWSSLPGQTSRVCIHPRAKVTNATCKWEIFTAGKEKKKISSRMLVHSILWHSLSHFTAYIWTSSPHHINKTRYIYFPVSYINNPLAKICTHLLKYIAEYIWFPLEVLLWKSYFWHSLFHWCKHVNSKNVEKFIDFNSWDGKNI